MKKKRKNKKIESKSGRMGAGWVILAVAVGVVCAIIWLRSRQDPPETREARYAPRPKGELSFTKHIAPVIFENCSGCHRPGQAAPFALLSFADVRKHARDIVTATESRYMPPWLPEPGHGDFVGSRRMTIEQIGMINQWVNEGTLEGNAADLPPTPKWERDWHLGAPDLVIEMPEVYRLSAEGRDVYRNFVIPVPITQKRYVKAIEFRPGNLKVVHHAFVKVDRTEQSRHLDGKDAEPGFPGLVVPAEIPDGHFLGWQPGRIPSPLPEGLPFQIDPGNDFVLQMHMNPSGKLEELRPSIGLYFTESPPTNKCFRMFLSSYVIDIPAGATNHTVEDRFVLPVDTQLLAVLPHAHYLAKEFQGWATRPNGQREPLLWIQQWDFNWQSDYRYREPVLLPKGTELAMRITYDNSTNNVRNPNNPPKLVSYGPQSSDEMAEVWFQLLPKDSADLAVLNQRYEAHVKKRFVAHNEHLLRKNPNDPKANADFALVRMSEGKLREAEQHLQTAIKAQPDYALAHYYYGVVLRMAKRLADARHEFELTLKLEPNNSKAHGNLGFVLLELGDRRLARTHFEEALRINPFDELAKGALEEIPAARE